MSAGAGMKRTTAYTVEGSHAHWNTTSLRLLTACKIAERYQRRLPTWEELRDEFGMDRSTAYRWLSALKQARGVA